MINITAYTEDNTKIEAIKVFMKALKIKYELAGDKSPYDPDFVKKIKQGDVDMKNGKRKTVTFKQLDDLWK